LALTSGARLGPYEILSAIGAGGMGEVYKARDTRLDRLVAIKVLPEAFAGDPQFRERFDREARAISHLDHPHICALYDVGEERGTAYLVMQYLEGETLAARLTHAKGPLPLEHVLNIGIDIADALDKAHRAGIVHRDLKPANVMLTKSGAKLLDFGLAKLRGPTGPITMSAMTVMATATGTILGTIQYMAPEQIEGRDADKRADIWALGAVLYEMATRQRAFDGASAASLIGAIMRDTPPAVSARQPLAPSALDHVVERCLEKDADERWQDAGDVKRELAWVAGHRSRAEADGTLAQPTRRAIAPWIIAAGVVATAALGLATLQRPHPNASVTRRMMLSIAPTDQVRPSGSFALSPDGRHFAFVGLATDGPPSLWVRSIDTAAIQLLPGTEDASFPFWSPRSDAIGFFAGGKLKTVAIADGVPKTLAPASNGRGGSWSVDGTILYAFVNSPLYRVSHQGGASTVVTSFDPQHRQISHRWPVFLDSRHFVYTAQGGAADGTGIYLGSLDSPAATRLVGAYSNSAVVDGRLLFVSEGTLVAQSLDLDGGRLTGDTLEIARPVAINGGLGFAAFSTSSAGVLAYTSGGAAAGTSELRWFDRQGKPLGPLGVETGVIGDTPYNARLSPDERTLAINTFRSATSDIWLVDIARDVASRFTSDDANDQFPVWSPDGTELLFSSNRGGGGVYNMYRKPVARSEEETLVFKSAANQYSTDWSRDGRIILFTNVDPKTQADIWMAPATGSWQSTPVLITGFNEYAARLSPNGRWMAYTSDESGQLEVYVRRFPEATGRVKISTKGGSEPTWRADGRELFYLAANRTLNAVTVTTTADFSAERPTKLFDAIVDTIVGSIHSNHYTPTADGQRFLINVSAVSGTPTTVVLNWAPWAKP
jgi:eukaryotic-like serine/threonine-protein kinase